MKRKLLLTNACMGLMILFAIAFQSIHSLEHLVKQFSEKKCHHVYHSHKTEVNHGHDGLEKCFVCEFAFSNYAELKSKEISFLRTPIIGNLLFYHTTDKIVFYSGSSFLLRGPPVV
jgi:hypothetical protein